MKVVRSAVVTLRGLFQWLVARLVSWVSLSSSPQEFRDLAVRKNDEGRKLILSIQAYRNAFLDKFFYLYSWTAESEFYQLVLPILFWNFDTTLARHLTSIVILTIISGNVVKDMFRLTRPTGVWVSPDAVSGDDTAIKDFGFPSTHTASAITNSWFIVWWLYDQGAYPGNALAWALIIAAAAFHTICLPLSRLYLGVHYPFDLHGGAVVGVFVLATYVGMCKTFDSFFMTAPLWQSWGALLVGELVLLAICPQPRPRTPSFLQNAFLSGLFIGNYVGNRLMRENAALLTAVAGIGNQIQGSLFVTSYASSIGLFLCRTVLGVAVVMLHRLVFKPLSLFVISRLFGLDPASIAFSKRNVIVEEESVDDKSSKLMGLTPADPKDSPETSSLIAAEAFLKHGTYIAVAVGITFTAPIVLACLGLVGPDQYTCGSWKLLGIDFNTCTY